MTDTFGGRLGGSRAYERSAQWAAEQFRAMGIREVKLEALQLPVADTEIRLIARNNEILGTAKVTFAPGTYIIKDGPFRVSDTATATVLERASLPMDAVRWKRVFLGSAMDVDLDSSGRLLIAPDKLITTYGGMLGKVYTEILESGDSHATITLLRNGAGRLQAFFYGLLPQNAAELTSYTVYRWECAIRSSAVLGFVGAGGLGQAMDSSMKMFNGAEVATMLLVFMVLVWVADRASTWLRKALG